MANGYETMIRLSLAARADMLESVAGLSEAYVRLIALGRSQKASKRETEIVAGSPYFYSFGDGWAASVSARIVDATEARGLRKQSAGFCGYDWMIEEIRSHGRILSLSERAA